MARKTASPREGDSGGGGADGNSDGPGTEGGGDGRGAGASAAAPPVSLYEILGVSRTASAEEIGRQFRKQALRLHPDKAGGDQRKFQELLAACDVLRDEEARRVYDETGLTPGDDGGGASDLVAVIRQFLRSFKRVTPTDIADFERGYRGSADERADIAKFYRDAGGDVRRIFDYVLLSDPATDGPRFAAAIDEMIAAGDLENCAAYQKTRKKIAEKKGAAKKTTSQKTPENEAEVMRSSRASKLGGTGRRQAKAATNVAGDGVAAEKSDSGAESLAAAILARKRAREGAQADLLDTLAEKYAKPAARKEGRKKK